MPASQMTSADHWQAWLAFRDSLRHAGADKHEIVAHALFMAAAIHTGLGGTQEDFLESARMTDEHCRSAVRSNSKGKA